MHLELKRRHAHYTVGYALPDGDLHDLTSEMTGHPVTIRPERVEFSYASRDGSPWRLHRLFLHGYSVDEHGAKSPDARCVVVGFTVTHPRFQAAPPRVIALAAAHATPPPVTSPIDTTPA